MLSTRKMKRSLPDARLDAVFHALGDRTRADADYDESLRLGSILSCDMDCRSAMGFERENDLKRAVAIFETALVNCDAVFRITGPSQGADRETKHAYVNHIPVFLTISQLEHWITQHTTITTRSEQP